MPLPEERWCGSNLQDSIILRAEPDVAPPICADIIAVDESAVAYLGIFLPAGLRQVFVEKADAFSCACPESMRSRVFYDFIEDVEIIGCIGILMILRILQIVRIADAQHSVSPGSYPETMVSVEKERVGRIYVIQLRVAAEYVAATFQTHQSGRPGTDEKVAVSVFYDGFHAIVGYSVFAVIYVNEPCILIIIGIERLCLGIEVGKSAISSNP